MMTRRMTRVFAPILLATVLAQAAMADTPAPAHPVHRAHHARHVRRAAPPPPPAAKAASLPPALAGTEPAPVPDEAVSDVPPGQAPATRVTPSMLQLHYPNVGDGYVQGSSPQAMDDRNAAKAPGVEMQVPLRQ
jgi:hypothetical protein